MMRIIYDSFLRVLVICNFHHNLRDFLAVFKEILFHIKKAILQFRFNVIMVRSETEEKPQGFNYPRELWRRRRREQSVKRQFTLFALSADEFRSLWEFLQLCCSLGDKNLKETQRGTPEKRWLITTSNDNVFSPIRRRLVTGKFS